MTTVKIQKTERQYYIDWLRIILIKSVFLFHIGMIFNTGGRHIMFEGIYPEGNFGWHHLWFIAYLFVIALFISPFLGLLGSEKFTGFTRRLEGFVTNPLSGIIS